MAVWVSVGVMFRPINAVQIHVSLWEIEPAVWRRLVVPSSWTLTQLHRVIQAAFGWCDSHLHEFRIGGLRYGDADFLMEDACEETPRVYEGSQVRLIDFEPESSFTYVYDFGDNWKHQVVIERFLAGEEPVRQASCIDGARARPPEDVGGVSGYENFLEIMGDKTHEEHAGTRRWCGGHFDADWFDLALTDKDVSHALRANAKRRLHQPKPKKASNPEPEAIGPED